MPVRKRRQATVDRLVALIDELNPFLDQLGAAYCRMPCNQPAAGMVAPLRSRRVRDLLMYRLRIRHGIRPNGKQISQAIAEVCGRLFETWDGTPAEGGSRTLRVLLKAADLFESWCGSASDLFDLLTKLDRAHNLGATHELPANEDAMGIWMRDNIGTLRMKGVHVWRPKKSRKSRLWGWRKVTNALGAYDTSTSEVSPNAPRPNPNADLDLSPSDTCGTFTEEQKLLQELINGGGTL